MGCISLISVNFLLPNGCCPSLGFFHLPFQEKPASFNRVIGLQQSPGYFFVGKELHWLKVKKTALFKSATGFPTFLQQTFSILWVQTASMI